MSSEPSTQSSPAWWRIVPKRHAWDQFAHRFSSREDAEVMLATIRRRNTYKVVPYNAAGKRIDA